MDQIVSYRRLSDKDESIQKFLEDHSDWVVLQNLDRVKGKDLPVSAVLSNDAMNKTVTMDFYPYASVAPQTSLLQ